MALDERGWLWLESVNVWLAVNEQDVVCYDGVTEEPLGDYTALKGENLEARERAEAERQRAEAERERAEAERQRADAQSQRADAEAQSRMVAEERLRELEAELSRLRGG